MCPDCKHQWVGVAPVGTCWFDCPQCDSSRAHARFPVMPKTVWECSCGNDVFYLKPGGCACCTRCGIDHTDWRE